MAGLKMNVEFPTRLCEVKGELGYFHLWEQWSNVVDASRFVVDTLLVRLGRFMALSNSKMACVVSTLFPSSSAMRRTPLSVHL